MITREFLTYFANKIPFLAREESIPNWGCVMLTPQGAITLNSSENLNTIFPLGSISKGFAAALTAILVNQKLLNWDDPLKKFNIELEFEASALTQEVTVRELLSHINILPQRALYHLVEFGFSLDELLGKIKHIKTRGIKDYSYQVVLFSAIAKVIESVSGMKYADCLKKYILEPLNLNQTILTLEEYINYPYTAKPNARKNNVTIELAGSNNWFITQPASGVCSSIGDLEKWLQYNINNHFGILHEIHVPLKDARPPYAMGWWQVGSDSAFCHNGNLVGFQSSIGIMPNLGMGIAVVNNVSGTNFANRIVNEFMAVALNYNEFNFMGVFDVIGFTPIKFVIPQLMVGNYSSALLGELSITASETENPNNLTMTVNKNGVTGILEPYVFQSYIWDSRQEIQNLRRHACFKVKWGGSMGSCGQEWYYEDVVAAVQDDPTSQVKSLMFLAPNMINEPNEAKRVIENTANNQIEDYIALNQDTNLTKDLAAENLDHQTSQEQPLQSLSPNVNDETKLAANLVVKPIIAINEDHILNQDLKNQEKNKSKDLDLVTAVSNNLSSEVKPVLFLAPNMLNHNNDVNEPKILIENLPAINSADITLNQKLNPTDSLEVEVVDDKKSCLKKHYTLS